MIYTFKCNKCKRDFEWETNLSTYATAVFFPCPHCDSTDTKRIYLKPASVIFKGEGFTKSVAEEE